LAVNRQPGIIVELVEFQAPTTVTRMVVTKRVSHLGVRTFEAVPAFVETRFIHDVFVQVITGNAELTINHYVYKLKCGEGVMIPAHTVHRFSACKSCRVLFTTLSHATDKESITSKKVLADLSHVAIAKKR
jgi:quercetin dioxygenase-like cupin family protein